MSDITEELVAFVKMPMEAEHVFQVDGDEAEARKVIQRIRVELSRIRNKFIARGKIIKPFKMILVEIKEINDGKRMISYVTLLKTLTDSGRMTETTQKLMSELGDFL